MAVIEPLPDLDTLKKGIDELLLIDSWDRYKIKSSPKKFEKRFRELFTSKIGILPHIVHFVDSKTFSFKFYRLRKHIKSMNPNLISEYSYPPNHFVKTIQRANIPYHPVFYSTDNPLTAIFETIRTDTKLNKDAFYYLSEWHLRPDVELKICPFLFGNMDESNAFKAYSDTNYKKIREEIFKDYSEKEIEGVIKILEFLSHLFIYDNTYIVSSYIAHSNLYANHNFRPDVFIYPSAQTSRKTVNFAVHPNTVAQKLLLEKVFKLRVLEFNPESGSCKVDISHVGDNKDGVIFWSKPDSERMEGLFDRFKNQ